jgi:c-di-GMP-binding flagellar brake protein YcgR
MRLKTITGREKILHHLRRVIQAQIHPAVIFEEKGEEFLTQILEIRGATGRDPLVAIDELVPRGGQTQARQMRSLRCSYRLNGDPFHFQAEIREVVDSPTPSVVLGLPKEVVPQQLRHHFRVEPFTHSPVRILEIEVPEIEIAPAEQAKRCAVFDISIGGLAINTELPRSRLEPGTEIPHVVVELPGEQRLEFQAIICSVRRLRGGAHRHRIGVEYSMADDRFRETLSRYIIEKQRTDIRRLKRELE